MRKFIVVTLAFICLFASANAKEETFTATLKERYALNYRTFHIVLQTPEVSYAPGEVLAIYPENPKEKVDAIIEILGDESLREHLTKEVDLNAVPEGMAEATDLLSSLKKQPLKTSELPKLIPLKPRYYSIASSEKTTPGEIHLTVVRFTKEKNGQEVPGLCSNFLCKQMRLGDKLTYRIVDKKKFIPSDDPNTPIIMISSGAGIAPFRGFMQERSQSPSKNWLIHGGRTQKDDFYYKDQWDKQVASGHLKITTAFSQDQEEKIYVQDRMREHSQEIIKWVEEGAIIYICGNSKEMVQGVRATLAEILGGKDAVDALRESGRLFP